MSPCRLPRGGVDRNAGKPFDAWPDEVASRAEAWIEMGSLKALVGWRSCRLPRGGVDRNEDTVSVSMAVGVASRAEAWIEIRMNEPCANPANVASRAEAWIEMT